MAIGMEKLLTILGLTISFGVVLAI